MFLLFEKLAFDIKYSTVSFSYFKISFVRIYWYGPHIIQTTHIMLSNQSKNFLYQKCLTIKSALEVDCSFTNLFISLADFPKNHNLDYIFIYSRSFLSVRLESDGTHIQQSCMRDTV